ncbi:MAG: DUF2752 domain-containing protein [Lachnospiraceae bacterium]|nr:DUF2752 domain-containing protein [Lachnospiraceae bacterium]
MKHKEMLFTIGTVIFLVVLMYVTGIGCPILKLTGIPCMGCGMTRAAICLFHMDFAGAWQYHPLIFLMPFCIIALLFAGKMPKWMVNGIFVCTVALFVVVYVLRLADPTNEVVKWNFENGVFYQIFIKFWTN